VAVIGLVGFDVGARPPVWFRVTLLAAFGGFAALLGGLGLAGLILTRHRLRDGPLATAEEALAYISSAAGIAAWYLLVTLTMVIVLRGIAVGKSPLGQR
jgi:hypothetical protein